MENLSEFMVSIEKELLVLADEKSKVEQQLEKQLRLLAEISSEIFFSKPEIEDVFFASRPDDETTITIKSDGLSDGLSKMMSLYMKDRPHSLRGKISMINRCMKELCEFWDMLEKMQEKSDQQLAQDTIDELGERAMDFIKYITENRHG